MSKKRLVALLASIALVVALVLSGCAAEPEVVEKTVTKTETVELENVVEVEKKFRALNPQGEFIPVETFGLSPRLDTLEGKTIYIIQGEADPIIMPALAERLPHDYPNTTFVYYNPTSSFGSSSPDDTVEAEADAVIRGIAW